MPKTQCMIIDSSHYQHGSATGTYIVQKPATWNPNNNRIDLIAVGGDGGWPAYFASYQWKGGGGGGGAAYAFAINANPTWPVTITWGTTAGSYTYFGNVVFAQGGGRGNDPPGAPYPAGNGALTPGGGGTDFAPNGFPGGTGGYGTQNVGMGGLGGGGGGAGGPSGAGGNGSGQTPGSADGGTIPAPPWFYPPWSYDYSAEWDNLNYLARWIDTELDPGWQAWPSPGGWPNIDTSTPGANGEYIPTRGRGRTYGGGGAGGFIYFMSTGTGRGGLSAVILTWVEAEELPSAMVAIMA